MDRLAGKVAIVTGGGSGIGKECAKAFAHHGAAVVIAGRREAVTRDVADELKASGARAMPFQVDVSDEAGVQALIAATVREFGRLDILHNNAALTDMDVVSRDVDLLQLDADIFRRTMDVNVLGPLLACKYALPVMIAQKSGSIIMTSSAASLRGDISTYSYGASKAALNWYTQSIAASFGKQGVRCNCIIPAATLTPAAERWFTEDMLKAQIDMTSLPRVGLPEDIANMAVFLASDESSFVTGQCIAVDGGLMSVLPHVPAYRRMKDEI